LKREEQEGYETKMKATSRKGGKYQKGVKRVKDKSYTYKREKRYSYERNGGRRWEEAEREAGMIRDKNEGN
jgi:hypothetical protein